jgi:hypothetical protein
VSAAVTCSVTVVYVGRTTAAVKVVLQGAGDGNVKLYTMMRTASMLRGPDATVAIFEQKSYNDAQLFGDQPAMLNVSGLLPSTDYDVYCSAANLQGSTMTLSSILATEHTLRTTCCKTLAITMLYPATVILGQELTRVLTVTTDAAPGASIAVQLEYLVQGQLAAGVRLLPSVLRYDNRTVAGLSKPVSLTAISPGNYTLRASVTGRSAEEYRIVYAGARRLTVGTADAAPAVPQLLQAIFSDDGSYVTICFDSSTDKGGQYGTFPCKALLRFVGSSIAQCQWASDSQLRAYPLFMGSNTVLEVGENVSLVGGTVKAKCTDAQRAVGLCVSYLPVASATAVVTAPSAPTVPTVIVSAPPAIGGCNSLTLDLTGSVGAAGRSWETVSFAISTTPSSSRAQERLLRFLSHNYTINPPLTVPSILLEKGYTYGIKVTLCNFLKACGSASKTVTVADSVEPVPVVTIAGQAVRTVYRTDALSVVGDAYLQSCSGGKSSSGLQYAWTVRQLLPGTTSYTNATLRTTSQSPAVFKLPAYTLIVGGVYTLTVTAELTATGRQSSTSVQLTVLQSDLVAVLKGSTSRYAMVGEVLTLDASTSYDKDTPRRILATSGVSFSWQCMTLAPVLSTTCAITILEANPGRPDVLNVTSTFAALNTTSVITAVVSDATRASTAQVRIIILQAPSPRLSISIAGPSDNVNTGKPLTLLGSLHLLAPCAATWSVDDPTIILAAAARTPVQQCMLPVIGAAEVPFNLVIKSDMLPQRSTLQFTLSCGSTAVSSVLTTNGSPLPGSFSVKPDVGVELSTAFTFTAARWSDPDLPLTYQFGFQSAVSLSNLVIVSRSELSYATSSLPAGDADRVSTIDCSLRVFDSMGAFADTATGVRVETLHSSDQSTQLVLELLKSTGDTVQGIKTALAVGSSVLNAVDCSTAPNCGRLNRNRCRMTSGQCGTCLDGFGGDAGDRNTICVALTASPSQLAISKTCAQNCSGHGQCVFVSRISGALVTKCTLADTVCDGTCACTGQFSGEFCELDPVTLQRRREVRSNLILSLSNLTVQEDINTESVASWSANLYALSVRPHEVSQADAAVLADIANTTLINAIRLGVGSYTDMLGVLQATDAVSSLMRYNYNPNDYHETDFNTSLPYANNTAARFVPVVSTFADMVSSVMVLGENETTLVYSNFRVAVALAAGSRIQDTHSLPVGQQQTGTAALSVTLLPVSGDAVPAMAIKMITIHPRTLAVNTAAYVSSPVRLQVQTLGLQRSSAAEYLRSIEFVLWHNEPQHQYVHYGRWNFTSTCADYNASLIFTYRCPDSGHLIHHNCSQGAGVHVSYCPKPVAACALVDLETAVITPSSACTVVNSTAEYTACSCSISSGKATSRRMADASSEQVVDDAGTTNIVVTTAYVGTGFGDTFHAADTLNDTSVEAVLVIVLMLGAIWATGIGFIAMEWAVGAWRTRTSTKVDAKPSEAGSIESTLAYVRSVVPKVFAKDVPGWHRLIAEIAQHHMLFELVAADSAPERRALIVRALVDLNSMFFLTAALFDVSQPSNDGSCTAYITPETCLTRRCVFDYSQTYCAWQSSGLDGSHGRCAYNDRPMSTTALFYVTILTTVIASLLSIPMGYLLATLKAPTAISLQGVKVSAVVDSMVAGVRRVSHAGLAAVQPFRIAPVPRRTLTKAVSRLFDSGEGLIANREIPETISEASAAARASIALIRKNASVLSLGAEDTSSALRSRSTRIARRSTGRMVEGNLPKHDGTLLRMVEPTVLAACGADDDNPAAQLLQDIVHQRLLMNVLAPATTVYDKQWGVQTAGDSGASVYVVSPDAAACIITAVNESSKEAACLADLLENYTVQHAGLEILHLFMVDLLGRNTIAAKIFKQKFEEEFGHSRVVVLFHKCAAAAALVGLNAFFLYFVLLRAALKGESWQNQYVLCCLAQFVVDILIFETVECAWLNFLVPQYVHEEVSSAAQKLRVLTQQLAGPSHDVEQGRPQGDANKFFLNAPAHLFVSLKLAKRKPQLLESIIVSTYRYHLPGEICRTWPHTGTKEATSGRAGQYAWLPLPRSLLRAFALSMQLFIGVPYVYQRVVLRFAQPVVFSALALTFRAVVRNKVALALLSAVLAAVVALRSWMAYRRRVVPDTTTAACLSAAEIPILNGDDHGDLDTDDSDDSFVLSSEDPSARDSDSANALSGSSADTSSGKRSPSGSDDEGASNFGSNRVTNDGECVNDADTRSDSSDSERPSEDSGSSSGSSRRGSSLSHSGVSLEGFSTLSEMTS